MMNIITHYSLFCGIGGGALGFQQASPRIHGMQARFQCLGGVDSDPQAVRDFSSLIGTPATCMDLFDRDQYIAWHGTQPPAGWREATLDDIRRSAGNKHPNVVFASPPCKGFSGLLPEKSSNSAKYQALNGLALRGIWLALEAWGDDPPEFFLIENVPRIASRGRWLLDQIGNLLRHYGYAVNETVHDCGILGGLAQSRKRFLLVARHQAKVPPYLYQPAKKPLLSIGEVIGALPVPIGPQANPMHRVSNLNWKTWVRLALIPPGGDWRSLRDLRVDDNGMLSDYALQWREGAHKNKYAVRPWDGTCSTIITSSAPSSIEDVRLQAAPRNGCIGVRDMDQTMGTVTGRASTTTGAFSIADPRILGGKDKIAFRTNGHYGVAPWDSQSGSVTGSTCHDNGPWTIADPRIHMSGEYGQYGVIPWDSSMGAVSSQSASGGGRYSVSDPRTDDMASPPGQNDKGVFLIRALHGGAWHRPFTTLELAVLQGFILDTPLDGQSDTRWRMAIGNAVPPPAARAIAEVIGRAIMLARAGETFVLGSTPVWVQPLVAAVSVQSFFGEFNGRV